jgi:hypothetical protein
MNSIENNNSTDKLNWIKKRFVTFTTTAALLLWTIGEGQANNTNAQNPNTVNIENVIKNKANESQEMSDKDTTAIAYLKKNLYVKWAPITDAKLNSKINALWNDMYQITYDHEFEWIPNFSEPNSKQIQINVKFTYKDNNIYISFDNITIWWHQLNDNWTITIKNTVYDYNVIEWENKTLDINSKVNKYKTTERIINKIKEEKFTKSINIKEKKELENTQITKLKDISLWNEVFKEWENYYREINLNEDGKYRPVAKVFFDKYGKIDMNKTKEELNKNSFKVLWIDVQFDISESNGTINLSIKSESIQALEDKVASDRKALISVIDKAKVWPNTDFVWFNKIKETRVRSNKEEWLFDTKLVNLKLINDTYTFQRWKKWDQILRFTVESNNSWTASVKMKNWNNESVNTTFVTIDNDYYKITLNWDQLSIDKIKKEWENITEHMPQYSWNETMANAIQKNTNAYYDWSNSLSYFRDNWDLATEIKCKKDWKWEYTLEKQSTNIDINDLYNYKEFASLTKEIKKLQDKQNTLDIDIMEAFSTILSKNWVKLEGQNVIKVTNEKWEVYYCTIDKKFGVQIDKKLYDQVEKSLTTIKKRLEIIDNIANSKLYWVNKKEKQNFEKFVWWGRWIGKKFISQNDIINFVSKTSDQLNVNILWWEGQETTITYEYWTKFKIILKWKQRITIDWQEYKVKVDEKWSIYLDPVEKK